MSPASTQIVESVMGQSGSGLMGVFGLVCRDFIDYLDLIGNILSGGDSVQVNGGVLIGFVCVMVPFFSRQQNCGQYDSFFTPATPCRSVSYL